MEQPARRVVITGIGLICPMGSSKEALWEGLSTGQSAVAPLTMLPADGLPIRFGAEVRQFQNDDIDSFGPLDKERKKAIRKALKMMCREIQMGLAAGQLALGDSQLGPEAVDPARIGVDFGADHMLFVPDDFTSSVQQCVDEQGKFQFPRWAHDGLPKMSPLWLLKFLPNMPASHLAIYNDLRGPNNSLTLREAAANAAVAEAYHVIVRGDADAMVAGATGTRLNPLRILRTLQSEEVANGGVEPARASRPFDRDRTGAVLGEGAAAVVLEELTSAQRRGATIHGEVVAGATSFAAAPHCVGRSRKAMANVLRAVLADAGVDGRQIGHLHAHGLSTRWSDAEEAAAIAEVFADRAAPLPVVAAKSYFGNLGAASGVVELIASLMALQAGRLFPILNYETPDPQCPIAAVTDAATPPGDSFINLNVTPQGQASAVLVRRFG